VVVVPVAVVVVIEVPVDVLDVIVVLDPVKVRVVSVFVV
jgi:hypothetical protein